jgi:hypothetical protein
MAWTSAWARATWGPAGRRATPVWVGIAMMVPVLFGENGMRPRDLTTAVLARVEVAVVLAVAWLLLIAPVGRALVRSPGTDYLRALPAPRGARWACVVIGAIGAQLPWTILWTAGEGAAAGAIATLGAAIVTVGVGVAPGLAPRVRVPRWRRRWTAAAGVHARGVTRTAGASLVRGAGLALLAGAVGGALVRINELAGAAAVTYAAAIAAVLIAIALAGSVAAVAEGERRLEWLARATGLGLARAGGATIVLGAIGAALGVVAGGSAAALGGADAATSAAVAGAGIAVGLGLGLAGTRVATWARGARGEGIDGARIVLGAGACGFVAAAAIGAFGPVGLVAIVAGGAGVAAVNADAMVRAERVER